MRIIAYIRLPISIPIVPTGQLEVTVIQSDDNQPRQHDESDQVTNTEG